MNRIPDISVPEKYGNSDFRDSEFVEIKNNGFLESAIKMGTDFDAFSEKTYTSLALYRGVFKRD